MNAPDSVPLAWLRRARSDLQLGQVALRSKGVLPEDACFHAAQHLSEGGIIGDRAA